MVEGLYDKNYRDLRVLESGTEQASGFNSSVERPEGGTGLSLEPQLSIVMVEPGDLRSTQGNHSPNNVEGGSPSEVTVTSGSKWGSVVEGKKEGAELPL